LWGGHSGVLDPFRAGRLDPLESGFRSLKGCPTFGRSPITLMALDIQSLLEPISDAEPGGADIRYEPITVQIREARRQEEALSPGVWKREVKTADYVRVIRLATEVLTRRSKDLQIAAWLTEACLFQEGFAGLRQGLELIRGLLEKFWDSVHPLAEEDGNLELRAAAVAWVGSQLDTGIRSVPLTHAGHDWFQYRQSCSVPTEDQANSDAAKHEARQTALEDGAVPPEEFEKALDATPPAFYPKLNEDLSGLLELVGLLGSLCDEKFGADSPEFGSLRQSLEEVQQTARVLGKKKGSEAAAVIAPPEPGPAPRAEPMLASPVGSSAGNLSSNEPSSPQDAIERVLALARYLRREAPWSPVSYLITRAVRWGELRLQPDQASLATPSTHLVTELEHLAAQRAWGQALEIAESAAHESYARAWLDLDYYVVTACRVVGNHAAADAITAELRALLDQFPRLVDGGPNANPETRAWLKSLAPPQPTAAIRIPTDAPAIESGESDGAEPTAYELAQQAAGSGRIAEALDLLERDIASKRSGRERFFATIRLAQLCVETGNTEIGAPILEDLAHEIQQHCLENWENHDVVAHPLALLYQSLSNAEARDDRRRELYAQICRLAPARALALVRG